MFVDTVYEADTAVGMTTDSSSRFVNGVLAHALDYDDTHLPSILHPSASVVPASLAVAEWQLEGGAADVVEQDQQLVGVDAGVLGRGAEEELGVADDILIEGHAGCDQHAQGHDTGQLEVQIPCENLRSNPCSIRIS